MAARRIVVTGATGNVGTALLRRLQATGDPGDRGDTVVAIARRVPATGGDGAGGDGVEWHSLDLSQEDVGPGLRDAVRGADAVVHLAWGFQPSHRLDELARLGIGGTRRVAEAVVAEGVPHLVHMSSVGAYSRRTSPAPVDESYPTDGVPSSPYSQHKASAERVLDEVQAAHPDLVVTRLRPGIIGQRRAGSALLRYAVPGFVPSMLLGHLPVIPLDRRLEVQVVHTDDVADAVLRVLDQVPGGAFNLAAEPPVTSELIAQALGAAVVPVPARVLRTGLDALWRARLAQLDPGWLDLAYSVPLLATDRATAELGWSPTWSSVDVLAEVVEGLVSRAAAPTPVLRRRTLGDTVRRLVLDGPVHRRLEP